MFKWKGQTTPDERSCFIKVPPLGAQEIQTYALSHIELMRGHFLFRTVGLLFSSALSFERFCDGPAFKLAAAAFVGRRSALQAYALSQPVKKPLMGFASMAPIRRLGVCAISSICGHWPKYQEL